MRTLEGKEGSWDTEILLKENLIILAKMPFLCLLALSRYFKEIQNFFFLCFP